MATVVILEETVKSEPIYSVAGSVVRAWGFVFSF